MAELRDGISPKDGLYPQINLNTGVSLAAVVLLIGMVVWTVGLKSDVGYHEARLVAAEKAIEGLRVSFDAARFARAESDRTMEGRLVTIEVGVREINNRLAQAERDRRGSP
jgi:hypothetical protein